MQVVGDRSRIAKLSLNLVKHSMQDSVMTLGRSFSARLIVYEGDDRSSLPAAVRLFN